MLFRLWLVHLLNNCLDVAEIAYYDMWELSKRSMKGVSFA